jgi:hypothetical protein
MIQVGKVLTVEELNAKIGNIKSIIDKIRDRKSKLNFYYPGMPSEKITNVTRKTTVNKESAERQVQFSEAIKELIAEGGMLKDLEEGLVDFRWRLNGKRVYLCWKYGEGAVTHWHGLKSGCSERKQIRQR